MTTPLPRAASDAPHLGLLIREHRGSLRRFGPVAVGAFLIIVTIPSYHSSSGSDDIGARLVFIAVGIACFAWYFFFGGRGAYASSSSMGSRSRAWERPPPVSGRTSPASGTWSNDSFTSS
jgi:hypothetical protein